MILLLMLPLLILLLKCLKQSNFLQFVEFFFYQNGSCPVHQEREVVFYSSGLETTSRPVYWDSDVRGMYRALYKLYQSQLCYYYYVRGMYRALFTLYQSVIIIMYEVCTEHCFHCTRVLLLLCTRYVPSTVFTVLLLLPVEVPGVAR